jgi:predicted RNase H-like nuclease (RuvC/YqgF family)
MKRKQKAAAEYVMRVREDTQRYVDRILEDNERLQSLVSALEEERLGLEKQLLSVQSELEGQREERERLKSEVEEGRGERLRLSEDYSRIVQQNNDLANLYVASHRLHATLHRQDVIAVIQEIVVNLIGSEEMVIFEMGREDEVPRMVSAIGIEPDRVEQLCRGISLGTGTIAKVALSGESYLASQSEPVEGSALDENLTACIPLVLDEKVIGVIAVFRLLGQKSGLQPLDYELFDLLGSHAATALYCTQEQQDQLAASRDEG